MPTSPYAAFAALLESLGLSVSPAELHGLLLGRCCGGAGFDAEPWLQEATEFLGRLPEGQLHQALLGLQEMARQELTGDDMALTLLLPRDEVSLKERAQALGLWCQGFLNGLGLAVGSKTLTSEALETLQDLEAIAQISSQLEESEDQEVDYMEVMEYLRVAPLLVYAECTQASEPAESTQSEPEPEDVPKSVTLH